VEIFAINQKLCFPVDLAPNNLKNTEVLSPTIPVLQDSDPVILISNECGRRPSMPAKSSKALKIHNSKHTMSIAAEKAARPQSITY